MVFYVFRVVVGRAFVMDEKDFKDWDVKDQKEEIDG